MKRALILSLQPPGCSGVQARRYAKLLPHLEAAGWEFHFVGPDPHLSSILPEPVVEQGRFCHYTGRVSRSQRCAIRKHRQQPGSALYVWFALGQVIHRLLERLTAHDPMGHTIDGMVETGQGVTRDMDIDLIAGICPDFRVLEAARELSMEVGLPFIAIFDDPYGHREVGAFHPAQPDRQRGTLADAMGVIFASPLTQSRYRDQELLGETPSLFIPDCYEVRLKDRPPQPPPRAPINRSGRPILQVFHPGNIGPWRPIDTLLDAVDRFAVEPEHPRIAISLFGYLYGEARQRIQSDSALNDSFLLQGAVSNEQSHLLADQADILLVLIGPRHTDNLPSKFFEYLNHPTPILVAGPSGNPLQEILEDLKIGVYCDINDSASIHAGLVKLASNPTDFIHQYQRNQRAITAYSAPLVSQTWAEAFSTFMRGPRRQTCVGGP